MEEGLWLSITDYSQFKNISISTIRRYIKKNKVEFKQEKGKYFIYLKDASSYKRVEYHDPTKSQLDLQLLKEENRRLKDLLHSFEQELNRYKSLVLTYENQNNKKDEEVSFPLN